jgi:hypothetical protein
MDNDSLKELKQSQLDEHAKLLSDFESDRLKLQEDKARLEIDRKLQSKKSESTLSRVEIDASVKFAEVYKNWEKSFLNSMV